MNEAPDIENFHEDVITNFAALFDSFNYKEEMGLLGIGVFNFQQKKNMMFEFQALYIALWNMALSHSFPQDSDTILQKFIQVELPKKYNKNKLSLQVVRINQYIELMGSNSHAEFSPVSHHILSLLCLKEDGLRVMNLKIALHIRSVYTYIFDRLF